MGSTILDMAETLDLNGDGIVDFVLPSGSRRRLIGLTFKNGEFKVLAMGPSGPPLTTEVVAVDLDGNGRPDLVYGRRGGGVEAIPR